MKKFALAIVGVGILASAARAQGNDPTRTVAGGITLAGWQGRVDPQAARSGRTINDAKFAGMGTGFHVTSGPAAIYWNPKNTASGNYTASANFTQTKAPSHPEAYGLFIGGKDLTSATQSYTYFLVRGDGKYLINHRANDSTVHKIVDWTSNAAVKSADSAGKATNKLSVRADASAVHFLVNGVEVKSLPRSQVDASGNGIVGVRVNHNLDVHVDGFGVSPSK